jgi:hypothetical protein
MATPAQIFFKKLILSIINFVKKNWFILILIGLTIVLFCALLKDNIEEPFDSTPPDISPDPTNPSLTDGDLYGIIPYEASANLYNKRELQEQAAGIENAPDPKKEFKMTTTIFAFDSSQENSEVNLSASINTIIINEMARSTEFGGNGAVATVASLAAATTAFNSIMGITATSSNITGQVQGGPASPGAKAAFLKGQEMAADAAKEKAKDMALKRATRIGELLRPAVAAAGITAATAAATAIRSVFPKRAAPTAAAAVAKKADYKLLRKIAPYAKNIAKTIGGKIAQIILARQTVMQVAGALLVSTGIGLVPGLMLEVIANICSALNVVMQPIMAGIYMGQDPVCPAGYQLLGDNIPKNISDALEPIPIIGDVLGIISPTVCWRNACPPNMDEDGGLCYDKCETGYTGVGPLCWSQTKETRPSGAGVMRGCPGGYTDIGLICSKYQTLEPIGKFNNDSRLTCPADRPDLIDGLCYGKCDYATPAYSEYTIYPRFIREPNYIKIAYADFLVQAATSIANNFGSLADHWAVYWATHGYDGTDGEYWWKNTPANGAPTGTLAEYNSLVTLESDYIPDNFLETVSGKQVWIPIVLNNLTVKQKEYFKYLVGKLFLPNYENAKKEKPLPTNNFIPNPVVPVTPPASFTEPPPIQEPEFIGTYQKCTGEPNIYIPPIPKKPALPEIQARAYIPAVPEQLAVPFVPTTSQNQAIQFTVPNAYRVEFTNTTEPDLNNNSGYTMQLKNNTTVLNTRWIGIGLKPTSPFYTLFYAPATNPPGYVAMITYKTFIPGSMAIPYRAAIPEQPAVAYRAAVPEVPEVPGYWTNTRVCETLPKPNPKYDIKQYNTQYAAWLAKKNNTPPPASTPDSAIPTWTKKVDYPAKINTDHVPGMPYLCVGKKGISYGRGAGKPKLDITMPLLKTDGSYDLPADPVSQSADNYADPSYLKCNTDYKSADSLKLMCDFYYYSSRAHAAEEAYSGSAASIGQRPALNSTFYFTYIKSVSKVIASSERSCDIICAIEGRKIIITGISPFKYENSSEPPSPSFTATDRRFYFAKIPALCNLIPSGGTATNTPTPLKPSYIPFACTNRASFAKDTLDPLIANNISYNVNYTYTPSF